MSVILRLLRHLPIIGFMIDFVYGIVQGKKDRESGLREYARLEEAEGYIDPKNLECLDRQMQYDSAGRLDEYLKNETLGYKSPSLDTEGNPSSIYESRKKRS